MGTLQLPLTPRARFLCALKSLPPLVCFDCGALVPLEKSIPCKRGLAYVDLCAECVRVSLALGSAVVSGDATYGGRS